MHIAVVMPAWNVAAWIGDALSALRSQTHPRWSLIVVDDGSTDATAAMVDAASIDPRIRLISQQRAGVSAARNRGLAESGGDAVLFHDADDWLAPDALQRLALTLNAHPDAAAAVGRFRKVPETLSPRARMSGRSRRPVAGELLPRLAFRNPFANGGHLLIRTAAAARTGTFRTDIGFGEDWEYWVRLALAGGGFAGVPGKQPVLFVRERSAGAYLAGATNAGSFHPCLRAILDNPMLAARLSRRQYARLHSLAASETDWIVGRAKLRGGELAEGCRYLRRSVRVQPSLKRLALTGAAHGIAGLRTWAGRTMQPRSCPAEPARQE